MRVDCVSPGQFDMVSANQHSPRAPTELISMGRAARHENIATAMRLLCGPLSSFTTCQTLPVNGSKLMY